MRKFHAFIVFAAFVGSMVLPDARCHALEISIAPTQAQREIGQRLTIHLYAAGATELVGMGVKVSFNPAVFQVLEAHKYEDFESGWVMDADADPATTDDRFVLPRVEIDNTNGVVIMIGGRFMGGQTAGLTSDNLLLGWIVFEAVAAGTSPFTVDLGRYHPAHPAITFDNFVRLDGQADEPRNVPLELKEFCVKQGACESELTGDSFADYADLAVLRANFGTDCQALPPGARCSGDINGDGHVNYADLALMRQDFGRNDCSSCTLP